MNVLKKMVQRNISPNVFVYGTLIDGYFKAGQQGIALYLFKEMKSVGLEENNFVIDSFVNKIWNLTLLLTLP